MVYWRWTEKEFGLLLETPKLDQYQNEEKTRMETKVTSVILEF